MGHIWLICLFTLVIHTTETLSYGVRLAGVRTGKLAVALSLTGMILLVSRTSNLIQGPMTGGLIDAAAVTHIDVELYFRLIIAAATLGTAVAILLFPTFSQLSERLIARLEVAGSIPRLLMSSVSIGSLKHISHHIRIPRLQALSRFRIKDIPKRLLVLNCIVTGIYTVSMLSALYATLIAPELKMTLAMSSGLINGFATVILTILVDPQVGLLTDKALRGQIGQDAIREVYIWLMVSRFLGTLLGQALFLPAAYWVAWVGPWFQ